MYVVALFVSVCVLLQPSIAAGDPVRSVRPLDHSAEATLQRALAGSALVRRMAGELDQTDVIVHLQMSPAMPGNFGGTTRFVVSRGGTRYLRTTISTLLQPEARVAMLGHELQHALEIASSGAHDLEALRHWWDRNGYRTSGHYYETTAAQRVERAVRKELRQSESERAVDDQ